MNCTIEFSSGPIEYQDRGSGPTVVLLYGLLTEWTLWSGVTGELSLEDRCIAPTLPLGAHRRPMREQADRSLPGIARLIHELIERLELDDMTVVGTTRAARSCSC
jgi:pimeloyl-ACP methyl ester carboxylesterase